ncbi:MAG: polysulfide reductase NrfD, partial [Anaerolineae bacterium]|nr:polysulfide reductase NrfD [Anaerolineae bacterium]
MKARISHLSLTPYNAWVISLLLLMLAGATAGIFVFARGLVISNLSDLVPWGLWITVDLSSIALSAGAFTLCALVYLLGFKQFQPMARTAAYIGLVGYGMAMLCLLLDIGRPDRFWHGFVFWNTHSVLWEVTMCVGLYFTVLVLENLSTLSQWSWLRGKNPRLARWMAHTHDYAPYLAVAGLLLSMLHQSSLGATYGVLISRPIWYRPGLAVLFFVSAIAGGIALTTLVTIVAGKLDSRSRVNESIIDKITLVLGWILVGYLYLRFWDLFAMTYTHEPGRSEGLVLL